METLIVQEIPSVSQVLQAQGISSEWAEKQGVDVTAQTFVTETTADPEILHAHE